jgi:amino acid adenylation domain-containing protein
MPDAYLDTCIHELFERQAEKTPNAPAVRFRGQELSYQDLNARANRIAHHLRRRGAGPEVFVGLQVERSLDSVVALMGILKAGGAYVHLDPAWPEIRRREIIEDCKASIILAEPLDFADEEVSNPVSRVTLDNAAYLIYTSGSTGRPKGVVEVHRSLISRLISTPLPDIRPGDICCLNSSHSFGISASRLLLPLAQGLPVVILPEDEVRDVARFVLALHENKITSVFMVPALLRQILTMGEQAGSRLRGLRAVAVSGGALTPEIAKKFFQLLPGTLLFNVYGGSEVGTAACIGVLNDQSDLTHISIGRPVANTRIYILDGEICVAARHLARGYLNQPALTAERFVCDPFSEDPAARMYRTGDLGHVLENGEIEFGGRADHQVKIRGFRVELQEIEGALYSDEDILEAAAAAHDVNGEKQLAAYIVLRPDVEANVRNIRDRLGARLPDYMIPATIMFLKQLPRTDNGKVDRRSLPASSLDRPEMDSIYEPPRTEFEHAIARIWEEVLRIRPVGISDHFLDFGGDSLTAAELISRIWQRFDIQAAFRSVYDHPTVAELADLVAELCPAVATCSVATN